MNGPSRANSTAVSTVGDPRRRHKAKDDAIRRRVDQELLRKGRRPAPASSSSNRAATPTAAGAKAGTVAALRPSPPVTIRQSMRVLDAAQLMAARRCDALLVVDQQDRLCGIVTDKDLAFRVVAEGLDPNTTKVFEIMTKNVKYCNASKTASEALSTMISGGFRHLPVMDDEGDVIGILDITKCLYESLERIDKYYGSSKKLADALEDVQRDWASSGINAALSAQFEMIRQKMLCPDLSSIMANDRTMPPELTLRATVKDAARAMASFRSTAILVFDDTRRLAGIFTSKDMVLRVMAVKADPLTTSIVRVMTPHPDTCTDSTSIYDALKMMHDNHYLHLPVVHAENEGEVVGLIDVLKLTYTVLEKLAAARDQDAAGNSAWSGLWALAPDATGEAESMIDGASTVLGPSSATPSSFGGGFDRRGSPSLIRPSDSASVVSDSQTYLGSGSGTTVPGFDPEQCFAFKFRDPGTLAVHRVTAPTNLAFLVALIKEKIGQHVEINTLSYADDDGDDVAIVGDDDLIAAVALARETGLRRLLLSINGVSSASNDRFPRRRMPSHPDETATELYRPGARRHADDDDGEVEDVSGTGSLERGGSPAALAAEGEPTSRLLTRTRSRSRTLSGSVVATVFPPDVPKDVVPSGAGAVVPNNAGGTGGGWLERVMGQDPLQHPAVLIGMGAVVTLSMVGLVSLFRH
ncbi:hypothetical protein AMAG_02926 [Allomyces macrogynus ATCC 38327]|uniref:CBS domain-containing protein n=1 Tax=Allomyces macrogynus (strain ATCC 38327) TaxID=578462 RepID=A0A0L0S457_ALLM3|nr:hypothetical protein AMAG_02926 [Allomyces macrogynus ATCC 38327]|eukprot:KNE57181.1 hypothetical protein AMAG_02926 [Allomyces macrogynus ATCC 38327]